MTTLIGYVVGIGLVIIAGHCVEKATGKRLLGAATSFGLLSINLTIFITGQYH